MAQIARMDMRQWEKWQDLKNREQPSQAVLASKKAMQSLDPRVRDEINRWRRKMGKEEI